MRWSSTPLFAVLLAAPLTLASSTALAGPESCFLTSASNCEYVVSSGGCEAKCTPGSFTASCDGACNVSVMPNCTDNCSASCNTTCQTNPGSFDCMGSCTTQCDASCSTACSNDAGCITDCQGDCDNRCAFTCQANPPTVSCQTQCEAACNVSCDIQVDATCHAMCTANLELPVCQAACQLPSGALFCDGQFIDLDKALQDCKDYLESQGVTISGSCTAGANGSSCTGNVGCSAAPALASGDRWGALGITGLMMGLGLIVSRRSRRGVPPHPRRRR